MAFARQSSNELPAICSTFVVGRKLGHRVPWYKTNNGDNAGAAPCDQHSVVGNLAALLSEYKWVSRSLPFLLCASGKKSNYGRIIV
jgi:hypothetical protein